MAIAYQNVASSAGMANAGTTISQSLSGIAANANGCVIQGISYWDPTTEEVPTSTVGAGATTSETSGGATDQTYGRIRSIALGTLSTGYEVDTTWSAGQDEGGWSGCLVFDGVQQSDVSRTAGNTRISTTTSTHSLGGLTVGDAVIAACADFNDGAHTASNCTEEVDGLHASGDSGLFMGQLTPCDGTTEVVGCTGASGSLGTACAVGLVPAAAGGGATIPIIYPHYMKLHNATIERDGHMFLKPGGRFVFAETDVWVVWNYSLTGWSGFSIIDMHYNCLIVPTHYAKRPVRMPTQVIPATARSRMRLAA